MVRGPSHPRRDAFAAGRVPAPRFHAWIRGQTQNLSCPRLRRDPVDDRVDQMRAGQVEATFAEFDFARFLYLHDIAFKFVTPTGVKGKDYDVGIEYTDGREACADAKCRLEGTELRADT